MSLSIKVILEAVLLCHGEGLKFTQLESAVSDASKAQIQQALTGLQFDWHARGLELVCIGEVWRFQTRPMLQGYVQSIMHEQAPKYSRAVMETLAVIAYHQPVTRGDIEAMRGVSVSSQILRTLEQRGWIKVAGHRQVAGRPELLVTTQQFLSDLNLNVLEDLPTLPIEDDERVSSLVNLDLGF